MTCRRNYFLMIRRDFRIMHTVYLYIPSTGRYTTFIYKGTGYRHSYTFIKPAHNSILEFMNTH